MKQEIEPKVKKVKPKFGTPKYTKTIMETW